MVTEKEEWVVEVRKTALIAAAMFMHSQPDPDESITLIISKRFEKYLFTGEIE